MKKQLLSILFSLSLLICNQANACNDNEQANSSNSVLATYLKKGTILNSGNFGLTNNSFNPSAIAIHNNYLYVGNDIGQQSTIERYDLLNSNVDKPIEGFTLKNKAENYNHVSDIAIFKNKLYVASLSSNRVDIYNIEDDENPKIIMSLGTGTWVGNKFKDTFIHPLAVAANEKYIFAADITGMISVYKQEDATPENHKKAQKWAFLSSPECRNIWCNIKLEVINDKLYASTGTGKTRIFDVTNIKNGKKLVEPEKIIANSISTIQKVSDNQAAIGYSDGTIKEISDTQLQNIDKDNFDFQGEFKNIKFDNSKDYILSSAKDFALSKNDIVIIQNNNIVHTKIAQVEQHISNANSEPAIDIYTDKKHTKHLLADEESWKDLTTKESFHVNKLLNGHINEKYLTLISYSAINLPKLKVKARLKNSNTWFTLANIDHLEKFSNTQYPLTLDNDVYYGTEKNQSVYFTGLDIEYIPSDLFEIKLVNTENSFINKINSIKPVWDIHFGTFSRENGHWEKITPVYAREWVIMITNFAYIMSSPEFKYVWFNYKDVMGEDFYGNAGRVKEKNGYFTNDDYKNVYQQFMNRDRINLGITTIGGGLGGGKSLGIDTWNFYSHYYASGMGVIGHEFGHHWGSHSSAFSNCATGLQLITQDLQQMMIREKKLPYLDDNINGFYKTPRSKLYNGVANSFRHPRPDSDINRFESYFLKRNIFNLK